MDTRQTCFRRSLKKCESRPTRQSVASTEDFVESVEWRLFYEHGRGYCQADILVASSTQSIPSIIPVPGRIERSWPENLVECAAEVEYDDTEETGR